MALMDGRILRASALEVALEWYHRVVATYCLMFGVLYWIRLAGVYPGSLWRFDLMPLHWQVASVSLAVLFPFAAIGLWMIASWGPVVWFICAAAETVMYLGFSDLFGQRLPIVVAHAAVAVVYVGFRVAIVLEKRREAQLKRRP